MFKKKEFAVQNGDANETILGKEGRKMETGEENSVNNYGRDELVSTWQRDAQQLKILVPEFDLAEAVKTKVFAAALTSGKTVFEAYKEMISKPKTEPREEIYQNARNARRGTGGTTQNPAKLSSADFKKYIENIKNG